MSRDTRIGMVTGLALIVLIGALLSMYLDRVKSSVQPATLGSLGSSFRQSLLNPPGAFVPPPPSAHPVSSVTGAVGNNQSRPSAATAQSALAGYPAAPVVVAMGNVYGHSGSRLAPVTGGTRIGLAPVSSFASVNGRSAGAAASGTMSSQTGGSRIYTVKSGDTLTHIAWLCYHDGGPLAVRRIVAANPKTLKNARSMLHIGQRLLIPSAGTDAVSQRSSLHLTQLAATTNSGSLPGMRHAQQAAKQFIKGFFPGSSPAQPASVSGKLITYRVKPHDTLSSIAQRFMGSASAGNVKQIMRVNHIADASNLAIGTVLHITPAHN